MDVVKEICDRMAVMEKGRIIEEGRVYDIFASPKEQLTKEFISSVISYDIPEAILLECTGTIVKVTFKGKVAGEGVISDTLKVHQVDGNFLHGSIEYIQDEPLGIFIMELKGEKQEIEKALRYIENRAAQVEVINYGI